jgi:hypothetical protein
MPLKVLKIQAPFFENELRVEKVAIDPKMVKDQFVP